MGELVWCEWGRLLAVSSAASSFWAFLFRKFFWDFIGGTLGPAGIIPGSNSSAFVAIIVNLPILQIFTLLISLFTLALEAPLPFMKGSAVHRSLPLRVGLYLVASFIGILIYQTVDCAVYYFITSLVYARAMIKGEAVLGEVYKDTSEA